MLKVIAENSAELLDFIENLDLPLSVPHVRRRQSSGQQRRPD